MVPFYGNLSINRVIPEERRKKSSSNTKIISWSCFGHFLEKIGHLVGPPTVEYPIELQIVSSLIVLEVEKGEMDSVFYSLKNNGFAEIFIKPDEKMVERYVSEARHPVIIKPFISRSPLQLVENELIMIPTLEKILVDLYCDDSVYFAFQEHQLENIYRIAAAEYILNFSTLFTYAKRRHRYNEIKNLLVKVSDDNLKSIIK